MSESQKFKCLLDGGAKVAQQCDPEECTTCGWEASEAARRKKHMEEQGLTLCEDGYRRLSMTSQPLIVKTRSGTFYRECWCRLKKFLQETVKENSEEYPQAREFLKLMKSVERKVGDR